MKFETITIGEKTTYHINGRKVTKTKFNREETTFKRFSCFQIIIEEDKTRQLKYGEKI